MDEKITNVDEVVDSVNIVERIAKSGKPYRMLQVKLSNGYEIEQFIDRAVMFMLEELANAAKK